jgi:hypothetical protein
MAKNMGCTSTRASDAGSAHRLSNEDGDGTMRSEGAKRSAGADKERIGASPRPPLFQVSDNRVTDLLGQSEPRLATPFSRDVNPSCLPVDIAETKRHDIARPKPKSCE